MRKISRTEVDYNSYQVDFKLINLTLRGCSKIGYVEQDDVDLQHLQLF